MKCGKGQDVLRPKVELGAAHSLWTGIVSVVEEMATPLEIQWKPSKIAFGHVCLLRHKKRTLLYLLPEETRITVAIVLGERACGLAMASTLPAAIKKLLSEATPYVEGRGIRVPVTSTRALATVKTLVEIKMTPK